MYKYAVFAIIISMMLSACQTSPPQETTLDTIAETTTAAPETAAPKDISAYEDRTAAIPDSTKHLVENPIFVFSLIPDADNRIGVSVDELYRTSVSVVRGTFTDHTYQAGGMIYYSFGVSEVLWGEQIEPETIVTVYCEQGITPLKLYQNTHPDSYSQFTKEEADRTYVIESSGEPFAEIGEEYILFLSDGHNLSSNNIIGDWYYVTSGYAGKYKRNEDGLYERTVPEFLAELTVSESVKANLKPLERNELKEQLIPSKTESTQKQTLQNAMSETNLNNITETKAVATNDTGSYEDNTAKITNSFQVDTGNAVFIPAILTDDPQNPKTYVYDTIDDLYRYSDNVVRGTITDLTYQSDGHYKRSVYYSVAVSEVLNGEQIAPGTVITVQEDKQGCLPLKLFREQVSSEAFSPKYEGEEENRAYLVDTIDKPLAKIGEEYVFFLSEGSPSKDIIGNYYSVTSGYGGKFKLNGDGLYEKAVPEILKGLLSQLKNSFSLEELKEQITN